MASHSKNSFKTKFLSVFHNAYTAWFILLLSLIFTVIAFYVATEYAAKAEQDRFRFRTEEVVAAIKARMQVYETLLLGGEGLFAASDSVTRGEWRAYVDSLHIAENWPGIQGMGYAVLFKSDMLKKHEESVRADGFPSYAVKPLGPRDEYSAIVYLEPFDWRNQRAFGFDMWSNDVRRDAMSRARDSGEPATSGMITLVQETDEDVQSGFLTYVPVYKSGFPVDTVEKRRTALQGWVYAPFRAKNLLNGILGSQDHAFHFDVYDNGVNGAGLLFSTENKVEAEGEFYREITVNLQGRPWLIKFTANRKGFSNLTTSIPAYIGIASVFVDLLLFYVIYSISFLHRRAQSLADGMTIEVMKKKEALRQTQEELQARVEELEQTQEKLVQSSILASLGEMAGGIAHEINNPLTIIYGYTQKLTILCRKADIKSEAIEEIAELIQKALFRIKGIVTGLRNFSRDSSEEPSEDCTVGEIIEETLDLCREKFKNHGIDLRIPKPSNITINCRKIQVSQVLINLLNNAAHAIQPLPEKWVEIEVVELQESVKISVSDSGPGIPVDTVNKMFQPFFTTKDVGHGTGLGLSISKGLIETHDGKLFYEEKAGHTRFVIQLPKISRVKVA